MCGEYTKGAIKMNADELNMIKQTIHNETGVPVELLDGETEEENRSRALALMAYKKENVGKSDIIEQINKSLDEASKHTIKTNREKFADWFNDTVENKNCLF